MTRIVIKKTKAGDFAGFTCEGHAGSADKGHDIVCAAISVLTINTVNSLDILAKEAMEVKKDEQGAVISVAFQGKPSEQSRLLMDSYVLGISEVFKSYGKKYIKLEFLEV
jgi:uncharacterized protein YsxB (DUF464 family)